MQPKGTSHRGYFSQSPHGGKAPSKCPVNVRKTITELYLKTPEKPVLESLLGRRSHWDLSRGSLSPQGLALGPLLWARISRQLRAAQARAQQSPGRVGGRPGAGWRG